MTKVLEVDVEVGDRLEIGGIGVFPLIGSQLHGPVYLSGPEAFEVGVIEVTELDPPEVPFLAITNHGEIPLLLVEGETLVGGDQSRTMNVTVLCPPDARTVVPVSCVEAGRWGARRPMSSSGRHAPGSLRATKTAHLKPRTTDRHERHSDQGRVWEEVAQQSMAHNVYSETSALDDIQKKMEHRIAEQLDMLEPLPGQTGVVCTNRGKVVGLDLFDQPSTLGRYLRGIVAGHILDVPVSRSATDPIAAIERFLSQIDATERDSGPGVGLGEEILLRGPVTGVGLSYDHCLVHLAAFPTSTDPDDE